MYPVSPKVCRCLMFGHFPIHASKGVSLLMVVVGLRFMRYAAFSTT